MARETGYPESCRELARTETSWPLSAADRLVEPIDLSRYGYAEKEYLETEGDYPETRFARDEAGNTKGGIRTPYVDAPLYLFDEEGGARRLSPEVIRKLYTSKEDYFRKAAASTLDALEGGWILKEDAVKILTEAAAEGLPELLG